MPGIGTGLGLGLGGRNVFRPNIAGETLSLTGGDRIWLSVAAEGADVPFSGYAQNVAGFSGVADPVDDYVVGFGMNATAVGTLDTDKPGFRIAFENAFRNPGDVSTHGYFEWHLETLYPVTGPLAGSALPSSRHISIYAPRQLGDGQQHFTIQAGVLTVLEHDTQVEKFNLDLASGAWSIAADQLLYFGGNNQKVLRQRNAAGDAFLGIVIANARNEHELECPVYHGVSPHQNLFGSRAAFTTFAYELSDGDYLRDTRGSAVTGSIKSDYVIVDATGTLERRLRNSNANGIAASVLQTAGGQARHVYEVPSKSFSAGVDPANSRYVISRGTSLDDPLFSVRRSDGQVAFAGPPTLPSYTVSGVPSASAAGAGAMIFVSDESSGAVPAFSDGTDWRRVTDRAPIA